MAEISDELGVGGWFVGGTLGQTNGERNPRIGGLGKMSFRNFKGVIFRFFSRYFFGVGPWSCFLVHILLSL